MKNPAPFGKGNDYMGIQHGSQGKPGQKVPVEKGNNSGPVSGDASADKGDIAIKGTPDFMGATPDAAGK